MRNWKKRNLSWLKGSELATKLRKVKFKGWAGPAHVQPVGRDKSLGFILSVMRVQSRGMWPSGAFAVTELVGLNAKGKCRALGSKIENFKWLGLYVFTAGGHGFNPWLGN